MNECCSVAGVFLGAAPFSWLFESTIFYHDLWKDWHENIVFDEDSYVSTYSCFFVDFLPYLLGDLGVCNREQQTWGNKVQQPKLNGFISGDRFSLRIFLREIQQSNNHKPIDFGLWRLGYGISLHNLLLGISPQPKN